MERVRTLIGRAAAHGYGWDDQDVDGVVIIRRRGGRWSGPAEREVITYRGVRYQVGCYVYGDESAGTSDEATAGLRRVTPL